MGKLKDWWQGAEKGTKAIVGAGAGILGLGTAAVISSNCRGGKCKQSGKNVRMSHSKWRRKYETGGSIAAPPIASVNSGTILKKNIRGYKQGGAVPSYYDKGGKLK
tara:strand:+ start:1656 stop:1973 length:318 start_codon:yes stop_codon:yes gene_type:complete